MKPKLLALLAGLLLLTACNLPELTPPPPTPTPGPTPTLTTTPTLTPIPSLTPTPTPVPALDIASGDKALADGDYSPAQDEYQLALASAADDNVRADALWGLGKTHFLYEDYPAALEPLRTLTQTYPNSPQAIHAWFLLGETYSALNRYQESADAYNAYLQLRPGLLDAYVQEQRGDAFYALANYSDALAAYQAAMSAAGQLDPTGVKVKVANSYLNGGDPATALTLYDEISAAADNDYLKAQMDYLAGNALIKLNRADEAYSRWQHAVANYPKSVYAFSALYNLVNANQSVDDFDRGLVDYYAGEGHYDVALTALNRYITSHPDNDGSALYYLGLTQRELGNYKEAIATWDKFITRYSSNDHWADAWEARATIQWLNLQDYSAAAQGLQDYAATATGSPLIVSYLMEAARIYEYGDKLDEAAALWESLPSRYPSDSSLGEAIFQAGIVRYRQEKYPQALDDFQSALTLAADSSAQARAQLWIGKTYQASGDSTDAQSAWQKAQLADSSGYYSLRARDLLENRAPFAAAPTNNLNYDLGAERTTAAAWLRVRFTLSPDTDLTGLGAIASDPRLRRGTEYWQTGLYDQARVEFESLREAVQENPADSFRLGNYMLDLGLYRPAIFALRQVLTLAGMDDQTASLNAPVYFKHARYGLYYADIVWPASSENGIDPLFTTSLIRQESLFEGFASSSANANGLMQIIPPTGADIAKQMGWPPNYSQSDLYSPYFSIRMGAWYFNHRCNVFDGNIYAALAAYNGGPGNAQVWQGLAKGDPDLLLEAIRFAETRDYIRGIYETYTIYRALYSPMQ
ncbi:MAG: tetratricopeptide repeat protein [Anaerolineales bacterium]